MIEVEVQPIGTEDLFTFLSEEDSLKLTERNGADTEAVGTIGLALAEGDELIEVPCIVEYDGETGTVLVSQAALDEAFPMPSDADAAEEAEAEAAAAAASEAAQPAPEPVVTTAAAEAAGPTQEQLDWFSQVWSGYAYHRTDPSRYLPRLVTYQDPRVDQAVSGTSWKATVYLRDRETDQNLGWYQALMTIEENLPYVYLEPEEFDKASGAIDANMGAIAQAVQERQEREAEAIQAGGQLPLPTPAEMVDMLSIFLEQADAQAAKETFWVIGGNQPLEDLLGAPIGVDVESLKSEIGAPLDPSEGRGYQLPTVRLRREPAPGESSDKEYTALANGMLTVSEDDNRRPYVQVPQAGIIDIA